ncbi:MAG: hypothetical protein ACLQBY_16305 [Solirubrobacteraceae bacterium]
MATIKARDFRIPKWARNAVARHEEVVVVNRKRPVYVIIHPDDHFQAAGSPRRGRSLWAALSLLAQAAQPDAAFAEDMEAVLEAVSLARRPA